jgi:hypothetical protein
MNLWFASILRDIYGFVNCRDLSDKLGCIRSGILLLCVVLSTVSRNILNQLNSSILLNNLGLILLLLTWWSLSMRKSDVEYAMDLVVALQSSNWLILYNTAFEVFDHRLQRSTDEVTIELLDLRLFLNDLLLFFSWLQMFLVTVLRTRQTSKIPIRMQPSLSLRSLQLTIP